QTKRKIKYKIVYYIILIAAVGMILYYNSLQGEFVFDDEAIIVKNHHIEKVRPLREAFAAPPDSPVRDRPVVNLTLSLNFLLGRRSPSGYHLVNLVIHLISVLLLFGIVRRTFLSSRLSLRYGAVASGLALSAALIWEVHPLQTESVTYITQRCESLMGLFYLGMLYSIIRGSSSGRPMPWYILSVFLCGLGMGSKAVMVTAPLVALIYDRIFLARDWKEVRDGRGGLYLALAATWIIQIILLLTTSYQDIKTYLPLEYALTQFGVITYYIRLIFIPYPLCLDYYWPTVQGVAEIIPGALFVVSLLSLTVWGLIKNPPLGFAGVWFFLILAPTSSILPLEDIAFEHRLYLPLAAVAVLGVVGGYEILRRLFSESSIRQRNSAIILTVIIVAGLGVLTIRRNADYRTAVRMWRDVIRKRPANPRAYNNLGNLINKQGDYRQALELYQTAVLVDPGYPAAYYNLANILAGEGKMEEAAGYYEEALEISPEAVEVHNNLGVTLFNLGRRNEALGHYREAMRIDPADPAGYYNLGVALIKEGRPAAARPFLEKAVELRPDYLPAKKALNMASVQ
ncbi:MAG: tetratricopeptide repeat protein, partial [Candidatus Auribacterota bacterium]|nr:tetratricopeptide repeat protein [Candidatus Auribacterota bacterium]